MRGSFDHFSPLNENLYDGFRRFDYADGSCQDQTLYLSLPKGKENVPLLLFFHGGGMTDGSREIPDAVYNGEFAVAEARYRLAPEHIAPAPIEDAAAAIAWCFEHAGEFSIDRTKIFVGGMSAGAYLAAIAVMNPRFLKKHGLHYREIAGLALISGQMTTHFRIKADLGRDNGPYNPLIDEYAPLGNLSADLPPILMVTGGSGFDMPARPEENAFMAASLRAIGHPSAEHFELPEHSHGAALDCCGHLLLRFLHNNLAKN